MKRCKRFRRFVLLLCLPCVLSGVGNTTLFANEFVPVDLYLNTGKAPLAAWQAEVTYNPAQASIVGIEGLGKKPPTYDPKGLTAGRIILADFTTAADGFGKGELRVARLHVMLKEPTDFLPELQVAAGTDGKTINATLRIQILPKPPKPPKMIKKDKE